MVSSWVFKTFVVSLSFSVKEHSSESVFIKSLHDVVNFNSECHILLFIKEHFPYNIQIKNPSTIKTLNHYIKYKSRYQKRVDPFVSVTTIKGMNCIYAILVHIWDKTSSSLKNDDITPSVFAIRRYFEPDLLTQRWHESKGIYVNPMLHLFLFTTVNLSFFQDDESDLNRKLDFITKIGIVLFNELDFQEDFEPSSSKVMEHYMCYYCPPKSSETAIRCQFFIKAPVPFCAFLKEGERQEFQNYRL